MEDNGLITNVANVADKVGQIAQPASIIYGVIQGARENGFAGAATSAAETAVTLGTKAAGAAVGTSVAISSVTVLGSHTLGAWAISAGFVATPVGPIIIGSAIGWIAGKVICKGVKKLFS